MHRAEYMSCGSGSHIILDQREERFGAAVLDRVRVGDGLSDDELAIGAYSAQRCRGLLLEGGLGADVVEHMVTAIGDDEEELVALFPCVALEL